jgi:hypothetical protein
MWHRLIFVIASVALLSVYPDAIRTEDAAAQAPAEATTDVHGRELVQEEKAEDEARKRCKTKICEIVATRDPNGDNVSCEIVKTWREEDMAKMLGGKIFWPWGKAVCESKLKLKRASLAKAMSEPADSIHMPPQTVRCRLERKGKSEPYVVEISVAPKVEFREGKATEAAINWGQSNAPPLIHPLIYVGTALDNSTNMLGPEVVHMVNEFVTRECAEVKVELSPELRIRVPLSSSSANSAR